MQRSKQAQMELLAPAGNWDCLKAAVANGADAVYFGVDKFNARARAGNFRMEELPEVMRFLRHFGVKGYVTLNILIFEDELTEAKRLVMACAEAGVNALIVQDIGLVRMVKDIAPQLRIHGSTQMTVTSAEGVSFMEAYGLTRMVLGRENNIEQIKKIREQTQMQLEVFVHGAICVSYSGQCLTSEMWGGRSANRGECAQACRLPYDLMVDGEHQPLGDVSYLLSPKDLAAIELLPELAAAGVTAVKIEGRMKSPEYVANVVSKYRAAIDRFFRHEDVRPTREELRELEQSFSRGFTFGFLKGTNHKTLLDGTYPKSRGVYIGKVVQLLRDGVVCELKAPLKRGDGICFDAGDPSKEEEGGRVYDLRLGGKKLEGEAPEGSLVEIVPGRNDVRLSHVHIGDRIWKTNDPHLDKRLRQTYETDRPYRVFPLHVKVTGAEGKPLHTQWTDLHTGQTIDVESELLLMQAQKRPMDEPFLQEQLGRLGGTMYKLDSLEVQLAGELIIPVRELNRMRREAVELLEQQRSQPLP